MSKEYSESTRSSRPSKVRMSTTSTKRVSSKYKTVDGNRTVHFDGTPEGERELGKLPLAVLVPELYQAVQERNNKTVSCLFHLLPRFFLIFLSNALTQLVYRLLGHSK